MANTRSTRKQARVSVRRREINQSMKSRLGSAERKLRELIKAGDKARISEQLKLVYSLADRTAKANVISPNAAARKKSRLTASLKAVK